MDVLVTGADERQGLAVIRALGSRGLSVVAAGRNRRSLGAWSRHADAAVYYPSPVSEKAGFVRAIREAVERYDVRVVMPVVESTVVALDEARDQLEPLARVALPDTETLAYALDKKRTYDLAESIGVPIPRTICPESYDEAATFLREVGLPVIVKPRAYGSYGGVPGDGFNFKIKYLRDWSTFETEMRSFERQGSFPLLQEYCSGICVPQGVMCDRGKVVGLYQHSRGRDYPLTGGVASVVISDRPDSVLRDWTERMVAALDWHGVAQFEYRVDAATGRTVLFEINGRFWAPISAAIQLGLNFPYSLYTLFSDGFAAPLPQEYPEGKRYRYLRGDLIALEQYLAGETGEQVVPLPGKGRVFWEMLRDFRPQVGSDYFTLSDPLPSLVESTRLIGRYGVASPLRAARSALRRVARR